MSEKVLKSYVLISKKKIFSVDVDAGFPIKLMEKPLVIVCGI